VSSSSKQKNDYYCCYNIVRQYKINRSIHSKDDRTNKKMKKSSNNKIACIFEDISFRTHVIWAFSSCFDQYYLLSKYLTLFLETLYTSQRQIYDIIRKDEDKFPNYPGL
jgi:hypothetical protein